MAASLKSHLFFSKQRRIKMNRLLFGSLLLATTSTLMARESHHEHDHGSASLNVAIDKTTITIELESPSESIYGFEHEAKTAKQIADRDGAVSKLKSMGMQLFKFDQKLGCNVASKSVDPFVQEGDDHDHESQKAPANKATEKKDSKKSHAKEKHHDNHSETHATYEVQCKEAPSGSSLEVGLFATFPKLKKIKVQVIGDKAQSGATLTRSNNKLTL
jgi:hypothetical protein